MTSSSPYFPPTTRPRHGSLKNLKLSAVAITAFAATLMFQEVFAWENSGFPVIWQQDLAILDPDTHTMLLIKYGDDSTCTQFCDPWPQEEDEHGNWDWESGDEECEGDPSWPLRYAINLANGNCNKYLNKNKITSILQKTHDKCEDDLQVDIEFFDDDKNQECIRDTPEECDADDTDCEVGDGIYALHSYVTGRCNNVASEGQEAYYVKATCADADWWSNDDNKIFYASPGLYHGPFGDSSRFWQKPNYENNYDEWQDRAKGDMPHYGNRAYNIPSTATCDGYDTNTMVGWAYYMGPFKLSLCKDATKLYNYQYMEIGKCYKEFESQDYWMKAFCDPEADKKDCEDACDDDEACEAECKDDRETFQITYYDKLEECEKENGEIHPLSATYEDEDGNEQKEKFHPWNPNAYEDWENGGYVTKYHPLDRCTKAYVGGVKFFCQGMENERQCEETTTTTSTTRTECSGDDCNTATDDATATGDGTDDGTDSTTGTEDAVVTEEAAVDPLSASAFYNGVRVITVSSLILINFFILVN